MSRGRDNNSWAAEQVKSPQHIHKMFLLSFDDMWTRIKQDLRTGTQSASEGPAKSSLVGPTPTPCSKLQGETNV